jgi:hypothetical protein
MKKPSKQEQQYWRLKLKASGFQDIEEWRNYGDSKVLPRFIRSHIRWSNYGPKGEEKGNYLRKAYFNEQYFRVIGLYINHCPIDKDTYDVLQAFCECGNMSQAVKDSGNRVKFQTIWSYLRRNFDKMITFVRAFDSETDTLDGL